MKRASVLVIIAKISVDMSRVETAGHLISGAQLCPRNEESAGKRALQSHEERCAMAQNHSSAMRLGGRGHQGSLLQCSIPPSTFNFGNQMTRMVRQYCSGVIETWRAPHMFSLYFFGLAFWDAFLRVAFLGGLPNFGRATKPSISDRRTTIRPATSTVVNRPRRMRFAMA